MIKTSPKTCQTLILATAGVWLLTASALRASDTDDRIESPVKKSSAVRPDLTNDASISAQVKTSLSRRFTSELKIKVETTNGVVTLTGVAKNATEKTLVTKLATDVNGVSSVVNNMIFQPAVSKSSSPLLPPQNLRIVSQ